MPQVLITSSGAGTWTVPADCPAGTSVYVETWGGGSGGAKRFSTSFGGGGGGGAYAATAYIITPDNVTNGVPYSVGAGSAGITAGAGGNASAGGDTSWGSTVNLLSTSVATVGSVLGVVGSGGALPTEWDWVNPGGLTATVQERGFDSSGLPYIDVRFNGTASAGEWYLAFEWNVPASASLSYTASAYLALLSGSLPSGTALDGHATNGSFTYLSTPITTGSLSLNSTLTRYSASGTTPANTAHIDLVLQGTTSATAYDFTLRLACPQLEQAGSASAWKSTPGYTLAKGAAGQSGTNGAVGGLSSSSIGTVKYAGGNGATRAQGGGGGGAAGPHGAGGSSTTATGGNGDNGAGGTGNASAGAGGSNPHGGGGGGGKTTTGGTAGAGGSPGAGGGGGTSSSITANGGNGANGQIRLTYGFYPPFPPPTMMQLRM